MSRQGVAIPLIPRIASEFRPTGMPLRELGQTFLEVYGPNLKRVSNYKRAIELAAGLGAYPTDLEAQKFFMRLVLDGLSNNTVNLYRDCIHRVYRWGCDKALCSGNPISGVHIAKGRKRKGIPNIEGVWTFIEGAAETARERLYLGLIRYAGLRPGEVRGLTKEDVWQRKQWVLSVTKQRDKRLESTPRPLKTQAGERQAVVRPELRVLLEAVLKEGDAELTVRRNGTWEKMTSRYLCPIRAHEEQALFARVRARFPEEFQSGDAAYVLRHSWCMELSSFGVPAEKIQRAIGHADLSKLSVYLHGLSGRPMAADMYDSILEAKGSQAPPGGGTKGRKKASVALTTDASPKSARRGSIPRTASQYNHSPRSTK